MNDTTTVIPPATHAYDAVCQFYGWQRTAEFNGRPVAGRGRVWDVIDAARMPSGFPGFDDVEAHAMVRNRAGECAFAYIYTNGHIALV